MKDESGRSGGGGYLAGARAALPFSLVVGVVAVSFGILARSLGWGVLAPIVFSVIAFSASAQFAAVVVLGAGGGAFAAVAAAALLSARFGDPVGGFGYEDEHDKAISWVILNPPPRTGQEGEPPDIETYLVALLGYVRMLRT